MRERWKIVLCVPASAIVILSMLLAPVGADPAQGWPNTTGLPSSYDLDCEYDVLDVWPESGQCPWTRLQSDPNLMPPRAKDDQFLQFSFTPRPPYGEYEDIYERTESTDLTDGAFIEARVNLDWSGVESNPQFGMFLEYPSGRHQSKLSATLEGGEVVVRKQIWPDSEEEVYSFPYAGDGYHWTVLRLVIYPSSEQKAELFIDTEGQGVFEWSYSETGDLNLFWGTWEDTQTKSPYATVALDWVAYNLDIPWWTDDIQLHWHPQVYGIAPYSARPTFDWIPQWTASGCTDHFDCADEPPQIADGDDTMLYTSIEDRSEAWKVHDVPDIGTIESARVTLVIKNSGMSVATVLASFEGRVSGTPWTCFAENLFLTTENEYEQVSTYWYDDCGSYPWGQSVIGDGHIRVKTLALFGQTVSVTAARLEVAFVQFPEDEPENWQVYTHSEYPAYNGLEQDLNDEGLFETSAWYWDNTNEYGRLYMVPRDGGQAIFIDDATDQQGELDLAPTPRSEAAMCFYKGRANTIHGDWTGNPEEGLMLFIIGGTGPYNGATNEVNVWAQDWGVHGGGLYGRWFFKGALDWPPVYEGDGPGPIRQATCARIHDEIWDGSSLWYWPNVPPYDPEYQIDPGEPHPNQVWFYARRHGVMLFGGITPYADWPYAYYDSMNGRTVSRTAWYVHWPNPVEEWVEYRWPPVEIHADHLLEDNRLVRVAPLVLEEFANGSPYRWLRVGEIGPADLNFKFIISGGHIQSELDPTIMCHFSVHRGRTVDNMNAAPNYWCEPIGDTGEIPHLGTNGYTRAYRDVAANPRPGGNVYLARYARAVLFSLTTNYEQVLNPQVISIGTVDYQQPLSVGNGSGPFPSAMNWHSAAEPDGQYIPPRMNSYDEGISHYIRRVPIVACWEGILYDPETPLGECSVGWSPYGTQQVTFTMGAGQYYHNIPSGPWFPESDDGWDWRFELIWDFTEVFE